MVGHDEMSKGPRENRVMGATQQDEIERKYDVGAGTVFPTLTDVDGVSAVRQPTETELEAVYFDTADLDLARRGITLRRRTGGYDAGWHLKLPGGRDTRSEVRLPLGRATRTVPDELLAPVRAVVRDRALLPVARLSTRRLEYELVDDDSTVLAQVCDDEVHAERLHGPAHVEDWREWEVELVDGDVQLLDGVEQRLLEAGAASASVSSKLRRALGDVAPQVPVARPSRKQLARGSAGQLLVAHLSEHVEELKVQDARLRAEGPGSIHKLRIAARRLRSALKNYAPLLASDSSVREELRWLGQVLSPARDAQVMRERLGLLVAAEPAELVLGPVARRIDDDLSAAFQAGRDQALEAVGSERYFRLLDALDDLVVTPPVTEGAQAPAREVVPGLLQRDAKRLRRAVRGIGRADSPHDHDLALHEARKKAKRLRYAAESAVPVFPDRARKLRDRAKAVQEALGEHQDTVVARHQLREYGAQTHLNGENGFTFGRLHALEQARAEDAERRFTEAWDRIPRTKLRRWIRG
jgi:CHAD domain-containing protein